MAPQRRPRTSPRRLSTAETTFDLAGDTSRPASTAARSPATRSTWWSSMARWRWASAQAAAHVAAGPAEGHGEGKTSGGRHAAHVDTLEERRQLRVADDPVVELVDGGVDAHHAAEPLEDHGGGASGATSTAPTAWRQAGHTTVRRSSPSEPEPRRLRTAGRGWCHGQLLLQAIVHLASRRLEWRQRLEQLLLKCPRASAAAPVTLGQMHDDQAYRHRGFAPYRGG